MHLLSIRSVRCSCIGYTQYNKKLTKQEKNRIDLRHATEIVPQSRIVLSLTVYYRHNNESPAVTEQFPADLEVKVTRVNINIAYLIT